MERPIWISYMLFKTSTVPVLSSTTLARTALAASFESWPSQSQSCQPNPFSHGDPITLLPGAVGGFGGTAPMWWNHRTSTRSVGSATPNHGLRIAEPPHSKNPMNNLRSNPSSALQLILCSGFRWLWLYCMVDWLKVEAFPGNSLAEMRPCRMFDGMMGVDGQVHLRLDRGTFESWTATAGETVSVYTYMYVDIHIYNLHCIYVCTHI